MVAAARRSWSRRSVAIAYGRSGGSRGAGAGVGGQAFLETAIALPVMLVLGLGLIQLALLAWTVVRTQAAADAAARAFLVHGTLAAARHAAATVLAPAAVAPGGAIQGAGALAGDGPVARGVLGSVGRLADALLGTRIEACRLAVAAPRSGDPVRLTLAYAAPLLIPIVAPLFADRPATLDTALPVGGSSPWSQLIAALAAVALPGQGSRPARTLTVVAGSLWTAPPAVAAPAPCGG